MYNVHQDAVMIPVSLENIYYTEGNDSLRLNFCIRIQG